MYTAPQAFVYNVARASNQALEEKLAELIATIRENRDNATLCEECAVKRNIVAGELARRPDC